MVSHECGHRRFPTNMPLADSRTGATRGAPANGGGRCWVAGRGHAPPEGGCGRWPAGALPRWLSFLVKQVLKQATTCLGPQIITEAKKIYRIIISVHSQRHLITVPMV
jgi:hypothetical protein